MARGSRGDGLCPALAHGHRPGAPGFAADLLPIIWECGFRRHMGGRFCLGVRRGEMGLLMGAADTQGRYWGAVCSLGLSPWGSRNEASPHRPSLCRLHPQIQAKLLGEPARTLALLTSGGRQMDREEI